MINILAGIILLGMLINILSSELVQTLLPYILGGLILGGVSLFLIGVFVTYAIR